MTFISKKAQGLKPYVWGEQPRDHTILKLNTNENPYPPSPRVIAGLKEHCDTQLRLYPDPTNQQLTKTLQTYYQLAANQIFIGNGSDDVLSTLFQSFFDPGSILLLPAMTYGFYQTLADFQRITIESVPLKENLNIVLKPLMQNRAAMILANPNAPTGAALSLATIEQILQANPDQLVIIDEAYVDFGSQSAVSLIADYRNLLVVQTCSKSRSLANLRIGFAFGNAALIQVMMNVRDCINPYCVDSLSALAADLAFQDEAYFQQTTQAITQVRDQFSQTLIDLGYLVYPSLTNFVLVRHPKQAAKSLFTALREEGILVRYFDYPATGDFIRISIGTETQMKRVAATLETIK